MRKRSKSGSFGGKPESVESAGIHTHGIAAIDLSVVLPFTLCTLYLVRKGERLGFVFVPVLLVKIFTLGSAIVCMAIVMTIDGVEVELFLWVLFTVLTGLAGYASQRYFSLIEV
jgi:hypothetical protein